MSNPVARRLYLRIWLAVAGSVLVLSLVLAWAWHQADRERDRERQLPPPREVVVRDAQGRQVGTGEALVRWVPRQGTEIALTLSDGQLLNLELAPRPAATEGQGRRGPRPFAWLRPPYGFIWIVGLAGLAVMVGVFPVARRLTQRLEALQRGVQRWGEGRLEERVPEGGTDEVADLAHHFNQAAERIEELLRTQAALLQSQKALLANASHELRSPLTRIRMALELMPAGSGTTAARQEMARNIAELDQLVDEILLASRLDTPQADLGTPEELDLVGLVAEEAARVGACVSLAPGRHEIPVRGVSRLLRRAVRNLLENAVRHGRRGGRGGAVAATLDVEGSTAVLHVDDDGPGVPPDQRERIFEPFYRLPGVSEREGGVGLGLALVRSIAQRHGGTVRCGAHEGPGARFTLCLPLAEASSPASGQQRKA